MPRPDVAPDIDGKLLTIRNAWSTDLRTGEFDAATGAPPGQRDYVYASQRQRCVRRMALDLTHVGDLQPYREPFDDDALERMRRGKEREADIIARLNLAGKVADPQFRVIGQETRFEIHDRSTTIALNPNNPNAESRPIIVGKIDGMIEFADGERVPLEIKAGQSFMNIKSIWDFEKSRWTWNKVDQLAAYCYATSEPWGVFALDRPGTPALIPLVFDDMIDNGRADEFVAAARWAVLYRFGAESLPPFIDDRTECHACPHFQRSCSPPEYDYGDGVKIITNAEWIEVAERWWAARETAQQFERDDKFLKSKLRGIEDGLLGPFRINGKWSDRTVYSVPDDIKSQYKHNKPNAIFRLNIERVVPDTPTPITDTIATEDS